MKVLNVHQRLFPADLAQVGALIDSLSSKDDRLWPHESWPRMKFDRVLSVGADGGHGPVRYEVESYEPGRAIFFRFKAPAGFIGTHGYFVDEDARGVRLQHVLEMETRGPALFSWPLVFRRLHDALIEDSLDKAERTLTGTTRRPASWSIAVRAFRSAFKARRALRPH
jgi:hypothetical protein